MFILKKYFTSSVTTMVEGTMKWQNENEMLEVE